jgi:hypothetical protein
VAITKKTVKELRQIVSTGVVPKTKNKSLPTAPGRAGIGVVNSSAKQETAEKQSAGAGIASPIEEGTIAFPNTVQRQYFPSEFVTSTDGVLTFEIEQLLRIFFVDAGGNEIDLSFEQEA